jgi:predicted acyltransferase
MTQPVRFQALDVFRGLTICLMIIVNTPGSWETSYAPLLHADWHGFTPTDLVFPSFLFAVGNAMSFVMKKWETLPDSTVVLKILKRTVLIFLIGYLMYWFPFFTQTKEGNWMLSPISQTRIFGVLQRIALCYGAAALMIHFLKPRTVLWIVMGILVLYGPILYWFGEMPDPLSLETNAARKLDLWLVGPDHLYKGEGIPFDPEGLLSTFPAIGNVLGGFLVGRFVQVKGKTFEMLSKLMLWGSLLVGLAFLWHYGLPVNKKLWTSSFVILTVGIDCLAIAGIIYIMDFQHKTKWAGFFEVFGRNPLFIYLLSELLAITLYLIPAGNISLRELIFNKFFLPLGPYFGSFLYALIFMLVCWAVGWWMDRKKIYMRI